MMIVLAIAYVAVGLFVGGFLAELEDDPDIGSKIAIACFCGLLWPIMVSGYLFGLAALSIGGTVRKIMRR